LEIPLDIDERLFTRLLNAGRPTPRHSTFQKARTKVGDAFVSPSAQSDSTGIRHADCLKTSSQTGLRSGKSVENEILTARTMPVVTVEYFWATLGPSAFGLLADRLVAEPLCLQGPSDR
jgi:hypothetical protein